ncbi:MAG: 3-methyl-2-oxobutanoate hydroxymethyltransferase [Asgard group archaeon]|nr:3-methyl-2-oxobutanoate hydroxymethyltransferase [Asgard group archaeon]
MAKITAFDIQKRKNSKDKITMLTAYDYNLASIFDEAKIDILLVGDTMGQTVYGADTTLEVTIDMSVRHCQAVARGAKNYSLIIGDMPFLSYGLTIDETVSNAGKLMRQGQAEAVKLEGASKTRLREIEAIVDIGIPVQGHIGLIPQSAYKLGGYKVQGKGTSYFSEEELLSFAKKLEEVGCFSIILEAIPLDIAKTITEKISIPTIGIGAGPHCDGQVMVCYDMLGITSGHKPKFVKQYAKFREEILKVANTYAKEVQDGSYPTKEYSYER